MESIIPLSMDEQKQFSITKTIQVFGKKLFGFIRDKVKSNEDAEDILQDVWVQFSSLTNLDDIENVNAWLYRVARNKVTDKYRKKSSDSIEDYRVISEEDEIGFKEILLLDDSNNPDLSIFKEKFWNELMVALDELPEKQREAFILNEMEEMTLQEIADKTGENIKTIISRKGYAIKHLKNRLNYLYQELNY